MPSSSGVCSQRLLPSLLACLVLILGMVEAAHAVRIKDLAAFKGVRKNQLVGYGLVVGLNGTGDKDGTGFTTQSLASLMERMGVSIDKQEMAVKNVAAVMVTAELPPFARIGSNMDVTVSSVGDAKSLGGGTLLLTPLKGVDGNVYGLAQGPLAIGGYGAGADGGGETKNHLLAARITGGATVEREIPFSLQGKRDLTLHLFNPDFTTAVRVSREINTALGSAACTPLDSGAVSVRIPDTMRAAIPQFIASIESLDVTPDMPAKVVVNEKTGTVVIGENVRISTVAVAHGNLSISVRENPEIVQPEPLAEGETAEVPRSEIEVNEEDANVMLLSQTTTIGELVRALNAIGVSPRDMISIFQSIKAAGALQAELQIL